MSSFSRHAYVALVYRFATLDQSAEILKINLEDGKIVRRRWLPAPIYDITTGHSSDDGFRQRGARGVVCLDGYIHVATCDAIHVLTPDLKQIEMISNEHFCDLHEFVMSSAGYVVTSTRMDSVVWCNINGLVDKTWVATEDNALRLALPTVQPMDIPEDKDWRKLFPRRNPTHLNAVSVINGMTLVGLHKQGVLWSIESQSVYHDARHLSVGNTHNHQCDEDGCISLNDTANGRFLHWRGQTAPYSVNLSQFGRCVDRPMALNVPASVAHGWLRGLARVNQWSFIVGQCPAKLLVVDVRESQVSQIYPINPDWRVSVHGISVQED